MTPRCIARQILNHWTTRDVSPGLICALFLFSCQAMGRPLPFMKLRFLWLTIVNIMLKLTVFPGGSDGKESAWNAGDWGSIPGLGRSPAGRHGNPLQYSCLENFMDRERSQAGYSPWGCKESDTTEQLTLSLFQFQKLLFSQPVIFWLMSNYFSLFPPAPCSSSFGHVWYSNHLILLISA